MEVGEQVKRKNRVIRRLDGIVCRCNVISHSDGCDFSTAYVEGEWIGGIRGQACNKPAVAVGEWRKKGVRQCFTYTCSDHINEFLPFPFDPKFTGNQSWFRVVGVIVR